jgi:hypothetical protein
MRPRVHPFLPRLERDERTLQIGAHPRRAVVLTGLSRAARRWLDRLDGSRDLAGVLREARSAGLPETTARDLLERLARSGVLDDAGGPAAPLPLHALDRMRPDLDALTLDGAGGDRPLRRRLESRVRVYGAGRVGAQVVALLASAGVGGIRVLDPDPVRPCDLTPGGLTWAEMGMTREEGAVAAARRLLRPMEERPDAGETAGPAGPSAGGPGTARGRTTSQAGSASGRGGRTAAGASERSGRTALATRRTRATTGATARAEATAGAGGRSGDAGRSRRPSGVPARAGRMSGQGDEFRDRGPVEVRAGGPYLGDGTERPDLVILTPVRPLDMVLVNELMALRIPHVLGSAFEGHGFAGPLVIPGQTACLHCLDLTRRDHDPGWPVVTARLGGYPPGEIACDVSSATAVAAAVAGHALRFLDGHPSGVTNGTTDITPERHWTHRTWAIHPHCPCIRNYPSPLTMVMSATCD